MSFFRLSIFKAYIILTVILSYGSNIAFAGPSIVNINARTKGHVVKINAHLMEGLTDNIIEAIHSGIRVTFTYKLELVEIIPLWPDRVVSRNTISNTVRYDPLKKIYRFSSIGRKVNRHVATRDINRYQDLMTKLEGIPIASIKKLDSDMTYIVRVKADVETDRFWFPFNYIFFFVPFNDIKTSWATSSPLVWKTEIQQVSNPIGRKNLKRRFGRSGVMKHESIRTFN